MRLTTNHRRFPRRSTRGNIGNSAGRSGKSATRATAALVGYDDASVLATDERLKKKKIKKIPVACPTVLVSFFLQAVATSSAFSDRFCIASNGTFYDLLSIEELTFCCHTCGFGCHGGYPVKAWKYFNRHGLVTGGDYGSYEVSVMTELLRRLRYPAVPARTSCSDGAQA